MIITLKNTTSAEVASRIVELRDERGSAALSRVLTLLICVPDLIDVDNAIEVSDVALSDLPPVDQQRLETPVLRSTRADIDAYIAGLKRSAVTPAPTHEQSGAQNPQSGEGQSGTQSGGNS